MAHFSHLGCSVESTTMLYANERCPWSSQSYHNPSQKEGAWSQQSYYNPTQIGGKRDIPITILGIWLPLITGWWISMSLGLRFPINRHNPSVLGRLGLYFLVARRTSLTILPQSYPNRWQINGKPNNPNTILVIWRPF